MEKVMTVNEAMVFMKAIRGRLGELSSLRQANSIRETSYFGENDKKIKEPMYDVKALDKKCTELENFLLTVETKIKQSNAVTKIKIEGADVAELLSPIV